MDNHSIFEQLLLFPRVLAKIKKKKELPSISISQLQTNLSLGPQLDYVQSLRLFALWFFKLVKKSRNPR